MTFLCALVLSLAALTVTATSEVSSNCGWVIVFDAGSTKTKMNLFQLCMDMKSTKWVPSRSETKVWSTALSQFNPYKPIDNARILLGFRDLFKYAETIITKKKDQRATPVFLYATAGLRALPKDRSKRLLFTSEIAILLSQFDKNYNKSEMARVQMISGIQEGQFAWLNVNYMVSPDLAKQKANNDIGVVDMGGGSTQLVFRPDNYRILAKTNISRDSLWYPVQKSKNNAISGPGVLSVSYKDYGFSSTAMKYVGAYDDCRKNYKCPEGKRYSSYCLHPDFNSTFKFGPYVFPISGRPLPNPSQRFKLCLFQARRIIRKYGVLPGNDMQAIKVLLRRNKSLFFGVAGYYYLVQDLATRTTVDVPSADTGDSTRCNGYEIVIKKLREGAKQLCNNIPYAPNDPFLPYVCIRATYVTVLLEEAYRFNPKTAFHMCNSMPPKEDSQLEIEIGWPLGVAQQAAEKVLENHLKFLH